MTTDLARWQFATTSIYHFLFVPVTIGLAFLVALLQTSWYRNENPAFKRLTKFFGTLLLINVAVGVVTGLVQEFEFGMNWSNYSRLRRQHLRGPAGHGGSGRLLPRVDLPRASGSSAGTGSPRRCTWPASGWWPGPPCCPPLFIMAANSWMQHPVGYVMNSQHQPAAHRHLGPVHQPGVPVGLPARDPGLAGDRGRWSCWPSRPGTSGATRRSTAFRRTAVISLIVLPPAVFSTCSSAASSGSSRASTSR